MACQGAHWLDTPVGPAPCAGGGRPSFATAGTPPSSQPTTAHWPHDRGHHRSCGVVLANQWEPSRASAGWRRLAGCPSKPEKARACLGGSAGGGGASLAAPAAVGRRARPAAATRLTGCPPPWCAGARLSCVGVLCRGFAQLFPIWSHRGSFRTAADVRTHLPACARPSASAVAWWGGGDRGGGLLLCQPVWWSCHRQSTAGVAVATLFSGCAFFF